MIISLTTGIEHLAIPGRKAVQAPLSLEDSKANHILSLMFMKSYYCSRCVTFLIMPFETHDLLTWE